MPRRLYSPVAAIVMLLALPQPAMAEAFCDFLRQVLAAKDNGFASWRGAAKGKAGDKYYAGTLRPQPGANCSTSPADSNGHAYYSCTFNKYAHAAEGQPLYYDLVGQMRRCYPATAFQEKQWRPEPGSPFESDGREISGNADGYEISLTLHNTLSAGARLIEKWTSGGPKTPMSYSMNIDVRGAR